MGKGYWHDVDNARETLCRIECPFALAEWYAYEELEFKYSVLEQENEQLKKELEELKKKQRP